MGPAVNSTLRKLHTVENWYHFLTARGKLVPINQIFRINISHFVNITYEVKFHIVYMRIPHIDRTRPNLMNFALGSNSSVLSLPAVKM